MLDTPIDPRAEAEEFFSHPEDGDASRELASLLSCLVDELWCNPELSDEEILARHPEHASQLQELLPTCRELAALPTDPESEHYDRDKRTSRTLGDYRIVREIGRGGMGIVYEAEQISLGRRVALKVLPYAAMVDPRQMLRFRHEVQAAALLQHQHIVPVYSVGCDRGVHHYAMQYVEGQTLAELIAQLQEAEIQKRQTQRARRAASCHVEESSTSARQIASVPDASTDADPHDTEVRTTSLTPEGRVDCRNYCRRVVELAVQAAEGLDHAHERGVVHRDVKPSNLILDTAGSVWITDFGLAQMATDAGLTMTGDVVGTLRYMSPEQALAKRTVVDHRTDIYSLGATLYELLTLRPPFTAHDRDLLVRQIVNEEPRRVSQLNRAVGWELETIVHRAMEKDPVDRFATAAEMADDLRRWLDDRPILARRPSAARRIAKWVRRHTGLVAASLVLLLLAVVFTSVGAGLLAREQAQTKTALVRAQNSLQFAREAVDEMYVELATDWLADDRDVTPTQGRFLEKALRIYQRLAQQAAVDPSSQREVATTYLRVASIQHKLAKQRQAASAYQRAIEVFEQLPPEVLNQPDCQLELAGAYDGFGRLHLTEERVTEAVAAHRAAGRMYEKLAATYPRVAEYQIALAANQRLQSSLALRGGNASQAESFAGAAYATCSQLREEQPDQLEFSLAEVESSLVLAGVLRRTERASEAEELAREAAQRCRWLVPWQADSRALRKIQAAALTELGDVLAASQRYEEALVQYDAALEVLRQTLRIHTNPDADFIALFQPGRQWIDQIEPELYCRYAETQIRQGNVLGHLGRYYAALESLGEAFRTASFLREVYRPPRYAIAEVNALAELARQLRERGRPDANDTATLACQRWSMLIGVFPSATTYASGIRAGSDYSWFAAAFPDAIASAAGSDAGISRETLVDKNRLPSLQISQAVAWRRSGQSSNAIGILEKYKTPLQGGDAYSWFQLALAHHEAKHQEEARRWLAQAVAWMDEHAPGNEELAALRVEASELLSHTEDDLAQGIARDTSEVEP